MKGGSVYTMSFAVETNAEGKLKVAAPERKLMDSFLAGLKNQKLTLTISAEQPTRSNQANRFYWGVVVPLIAEHLGYQKDELHEALKQKFLSLDAEPDAHGLMRARSTASMTKKEFGDFLENVITWAGSEFGIEIPEPRDYAA